MPRSSVLCGVMDLSEMGLGGILPAFELHNCHDWRTVRAVPRRPGALARGLVLKSCDGY
jgi:hypothetical protein